MLEPLQGQIVYLMFLNGILFLGLNFIAGTILFPGGRGSKRLGYALITAVLLALAVTQELQALSDLGFPPGLATKIILGGFAAPVFLASLVYYRIRKERQGRTPPPH